MTLVGKTDGDKFIRLKENHQMTLSNQPLEGDIVEVLGRYFQVLAGDQGAGEVLMRDITPAFNEVVDNDE